MPPATLDSRRMTPVTIVVTLTLLMGTAAGHDRPVPAGAAAADARTGRADGAAQLTMSALILAFGIAQLVWGPLADRFGRRPVLLAGVWRCTPLASIGAARWRRSIDTLVVWRALQGAAMAAAVVCARAIVRDLYEPTRGRAA